MNQPQKKKSTDQSAGKKGQEKNEKPPVLDHALEELKQRLLYSKTGLINAGGSCYMASIIQILVHLKPFLDIFLKGHYRSHLSKKFFEFISSFTKGNNSIEIKYFAGDYNHINKKFCGEDGNNPMTFFTEFISELSKENKEIINLFKGKKLISYDQNEKFDESFLFYLVILDKNNPHITELINDGKKYDGVENNSSILTEKIVEMPEILIINLEIEKNITYTGEDYIVIDEQSYKLVAINKYSDYHSVA